MDRRRLLECPGENNGDREAEEGQRQEKSHRPRRELERLKNEVGYLQQYEAGRTVHRHDPEYTPAFQLGEEPFVSRVGSGMEAETAVHGADWVDISWNLRAAASAFQ